MEKTILITGATDGIGLETAKMLIIKGHNVLVHGRNPEKLTLVLSELSKLASTALIRGYTADLSKLSNVETLAASVIKDHKKIDVLINNAGVYAISNPETEDGLDARFTVNTIAPYLLTQKLLPIMGNDSRVINVSSAAQASVDLSVLSGKPSLGDGMAYAQSKLGITMWSKALADKLDRKGPMVVAVNPASMLGSKMVKEAYGVAGGELSIGADILCRAALSDEFAMASGQYYDNDIGQFASPHEDALDANKNRALVSSIENILTKKLR